MLAICLRTGQLQIMKDEMDDACLVLKTGMQASNIKWNSNGSVLAVSGVMGNTGPAAALVQFYSYSGRCLHQLPLQLLHVHSPTNVQLSITACSSSVTSSFVFWPVQSLNAKRVSAAFASPLFSSSKHYVAQMLCH